MIRSAGVAIAVAVTLTGCAGTDRPALIEDTTVSTTTAPATTTTTAAPTTTTEPPHPAAPNGRTYPAISADPGDVGARLVEIEWLVRGTPRDDPAFADYAHEQQLLYRHIGRNPDWLPTIRGLIPDSLSPSVELQIAGRQAIAGIPSGDPPVNVPAWEIIEPLPADKLLELYDAAAADTGIGWSYLAAINLLETGFGRIDGLSTAGAQGPMQFLPTTWEEVSDGDINDPVDAIPAAARYLVRRGGPDDMERALWGYNNSDHYVAAVTAYAELFAADIASFYAAHGWEIHYSAAIADLWLPVGYRLEESASATDYIVASPWSAPPPPATQ